MPRRQKSPWRPVAYLLPPLMLTATLAAAALVLQRPLAIFGWVMAGVFGVALLWIFVSVLWPARAERTCPACGQEGIERMDAERTHGLHCRLCGYRDESASSWLLAEEEGPLEHIVMAQRRERKKARRSSVDSTATSD